MKTYRLKRMDVDEEGNDLSYGYWLKKRGRYGPLTLPDGYVYAGDFQGAEQALRIRLLNEEECKRVIEVQIP